MTHDGKVICRVRTAICDYIARQFPDSGMLPDVKHGQLFVTWQFLVTTYSEGSFMPFVGKPVLVLEKAKSKSQPIS